MEVTIRRGKHTFFKIPRLTFSRKIEISFRLVGDFSYVRDFPENQKDTNKIFGISDSFYHRKDSIRIGFRYLNNNLELMAYYYNNGVRKSEKIQNIETDMDYLVKIKITDNSYLIEFDSKEHLFPRTSRWKFLRYLLYPYFGGQEKAKKDLTFRIEYKLE
jgi:hypothetical protein